MSVRQRLTSNHFAKLLGDDCPPSDRCFFAYLAMSLGLSQHPARYGKFLLHDGQHWSYYGDPHPREESDVIEQVYGQARSRNKQRRLRARLRKRQQMLNQRLSDRKAPFRVVRPGRGLLFLWPTIDIEMLDKVRKDVAARRRTKKIESRRERDQARTGSKPRELTLEQSLMAFLIHTAPGLEACMQFLREMLANGPRPSDAVKKAWLEREGRLSMLRRALRELHAKRYPATFGGHWLIELPSQK